jgi:hypothetical protein
LKENEMKSFEQRKQELHTEIIRAERDLTGLRAHLMGLEEAEKLLKMPAAPSAKKRGRPRKTRGNGPAVVEAHNHGEQPDLGSVDL